MKNRNASQFLILIFVLIIAFFIGVFSAFVFQRVSCIHSCKNAKDFLLPVHKSIRFKIYGTGLNTISGRFSFYDKNGKEISVIERSWKGMELYLDFSSVEMGGIKLLFPLYLYTVSSASRGVDLQRYYIVDSVCRIYSDFTDSKSEIKDIMNLSIFALSKIKNPFAPNSSKIYTIRLSAYENGIDYAILTTANGTITVVPD